MPETKNLIWIGIFISHHLRNPKFGYGHWGCPCHKLGAKSGGVLGVCLSNLLYRHLYSSNWNGFGSIQFISIHTQCDCLFKLVHIASLCIGYEQDDQAGGRMREKTNMERKSTLSFFAHNKIIFAPSDNAFQNLIFGKHSWEVKFKTGNKMQNQMGVGHLSQKGLRFCINCF